MIGKRLSENEEKFWELFDISNAGVSLSLYPKGEIVNVNESFLEMIGYTRDEVVGRTADEVGYLDHVNRQKMFDRFFASSNKLKSAEISFTKKSGKKGTALFSGVLVDINGEKYFLNTVQDITERKKAEEKVKENERKFRQVFNISPAGITLVNSSTWQTMEINDAYLGIIGYSRDEVIGRTSVEVGWLDEETSRKMIDTIYANNKILRNYEINYTTKSGQKGTALLSVEPIEIEGQSHFLATVMDITQRKKAEQRTKESEMKFRTLFDQSQAGISLIYFPSTEVAEINDAYLKMIGYTRQEVIGRSSVEVGWFKAGDRENMIDAFYRNNKTLRNYEVEYRRKSGEKGSALISYDQIEINNEIFMLATVLDITQRLEAEKRKTELLAQLAQANKDLESFSFTVSHDLRAPLRTITGYAQILESKSHGKMDEGSLQLIDKVEDQAKRMAGLIDDLLVFSRQSRADITKSTVDMTSLAKSVIEEFAKDLAGTEIILHDLLPAWGDDSSLRQVFVNLITNAQKYSAKKEHPVIEISSYGEGNEDIYVFRDNGAGFDMKYYDQLFQAFKRLHGREEFEGSGIGLAIVDKIVTKHGGRVWAESKVGEGATFYFSLPNEES